MLESIWLPTIVGLVFGCVLVLAGFLSGSRVASRRRGDSITLLDRNDRARFADLLKQLESWTNEYSGNVSDYQDQLGELSRDMRAALQSRSADKTEAGGGRVMLLLRRIMENNEKLKSRLDAAEAQLERQTRQIESYLTEARTDGLTGLNNRRSFDKKLDELFNAYRGGGKSFVLALIDIDKFKRINDTHGHPAGDQVLQQVARLIKSELPSALMVARFGGEEFAVLLPAPLPIASQRMNEVRKTLSGQPIDAGSAKVQVTISVGVAEPRDDLVIGPIVRRADEALYAAKNVGRNRVYYHDGRAVALFGAPEVAR